MLQNFLFLKDSYWGSASLASHFDCYFSTLLLKSTKQNLIDYFSLTWDAKRCNSKKKKKYSITFQKSFFFSRTVVGGATRSREVASISFRLFRMNGKKWQKLQKDFFFVLFIFIRLASKGKVLTRNQMELTFRFRNGEKEEEMQQRNFVTLWQLHLPSIFGWIQILTDFDASSTFWYFSSRY